MNPLLVNLPTEIIKAPNLTHISDATEQSSYFIARILMDSVEWFLNLFHLGKEHTLFIWLYSILVFLVAIALGTILKWMIVKILNRIGPHLKSDIYSMLVQRKFFTKFCRVVPAFVFLILIQFTLNERETLALWFSKISWIYVVFVFCQALATLADVIWTHVNNRENKKKLPLNGIVQLLKLIFWVIGAIIIIGVLVNKSPGTLLAGLGAFAAVLMLIFKDSILGVVAGVQLAENDSLHVGDWIVPNGSNANGTVIEVGLTAVKIENWDKTVSTVPPYNLITLGFKNYRNMQLSNTRQIQRSYMIDADSVVETTDQILAEFAQIPLLKTWIEKKIEQRDAGKEENVNNSAGLADGSIHTNLGVFRAYLKIWLDANPGIDHESTCFISTLAQTSVGIPLQVYCFTSTSSWIPYEGIQSSVFEHIAVMLYRFGLYTFEYCSGRDTIVEGYLSPGKDPEVVFGLPYPYFMNSGIPSQPGIPPAGMYPGATLYCGRPASVNVQAPVPPANPAPSPARGSSADNAPTSGQ